MFRKIMIVLLTLGAVGTGMLGAIAGSGRLPAGHSWRLPTPKAPQDSDVTISWVSTRIIMLMYREFLNGPATLTQKRWRGTGWLYLTVTQETEPPGLYVHSHILIVSFVFPLVLSVLLATYPAIAFIRGPVRRWRRRRKGLCIRCGYNLTGNVSGVCPECGRPI